MSLIMKDDLIKACADGVRIATGSSAPVKAGELAQKISELGGGAKLIESGEVEVTSILTSSARRVKINLTKSPDLFLFYLSQAASSDVSATVGAVYIGGGILPRFFNTEDSVMDFLIQRDEGSTEYMANAVVNNAGVNSLQASVPPSSLYPIYQGRYLWESYKLWDREE